MRLATLIGLIAQIAMAGTHDMAPAQASQPAIRVIDDGSAGGRVQLPLGRELEVELGANPSTGYTWRFNAGDPSPLRLRSRRFQPAATAPLPGSGGKELFVFETAAPGTEQLHFEYRRGDAGQPARTYVLQVTVVR
jgi:predicted secreted protein